MTQISLQLAGYRTHQTNTRRGRCGGKPPHGNPLPITGFSPLATSRALAFTTLPFQLDFNVYTHLAERSTVQRQTPMYFSNGVARMRGSLFTRAMDGGQGHRQAD